MLVFLFCLLLSSDAGISAMFACRFYINNYVEHDKSLPSLGMREFSRQLFQHCPMLVNFESKVEEHLKSFSQYKVGVPVYGCIIIDPTLTYCLLVKGWGRNSTWTFPKGKVAGPFLLYHPGHGEASTRRRGSRGPRERRRVDQILVFPFQHFEGVSHCVNEHYLLSKLDKEKGCSLFKEKGFLERATLVRARATGRKTRLKPRHR